MAIYFPDMEREAFREAVSEGPITAARSALREVVKRDLEAGADRAHLLEVLDGLADEYGALGETDHENAVLDMMDAMTGRTHPSCAI